MNHFDTNCFTKIYGLCQNKFKVTERDYFFYNYPKNNSLKT